jgi:predicted RNA-binding protein
MKIEINDRHKPVVTALKKAGYQVDEITEQEKKTIITISPAKQSSIGRPKKKKTARP